MLSSKGETKILDFGLARVGPWDEASAELTTVGQLMGTLDYMAPEQAERAESVDYRADLYSLGATLFRLLCGRAPLAASPDLSPLAKLRLLATHEPPRLDTLRPDAPSQLVALVASLLARDPADRPASAAHVAEQLQPFISGNQLTELVARAVGASQNEPSGKRDVPPAVLPLQTVTTPRNSHWRRWLTAAALLPLAILGGVLITLETQKGQLVIDSEVGNVSVRILREGEMHRELKIEPGANVTRVYAGKYQVEIDQGSDSLHIVDGDIVIQKGETRIAHLRQSNTEPAIAANLPSNSSEPMYDGKPLSEWLDIVAREHSPTALFNAFEAVKALVSTETSEQITQALLRILSTMDGETRIASEKRNQASTIDSEGFRILRAGNRGEAYAKLLVSELRKGNTAWSSRVLQRAVLADRDFQPLVAWISQHILAANDPELAETACKYYYFRLFMQSYPTQAEQRAMLRDLEQCTALGNTLWLGIYPDQLASESVVNPMLLDAIQARAVAALIDEATEPKLVAQAAMIVQFALSNPLYGGLDSISRLDELRTAIRRRLAKIGTEQLYELTSVESGFPTTPKPEAWAGRGSIHREVWSDPTEACFTIVLLELAESLEISDMQDILVPMSQATESSFASMDRWLKQGRQISFNWPPKQINYSIGGEQLS